MNRLFLTVAPRARRDLADIRAWLIKEAGPRVSAKVVDAIRRRIDNLRSSPHTGVAQPDLGQGARFATVGAYVVYYEHDGSGLNVLRILHGARDRKAIMVREAENRR